MSGLFKKKGGKRNLRKKNESDEENNTTEGTNTTTSATGFGISAPVITTPVIHSAPSSSSLLSFGQDVDEEECGTTFKIKKSSHSKRLDKFRRKIREQRKKDDNLEEANSARVETSVSSQSPADAKSPSKELNLADIDSTKSSITDNNQESNGQVLGNNNTVGGGKSVLEGGSIPDAHQVYLARKRRQRAREEGDYIPLDDDTQKYHKNKSRLVREDENDISDMEEEGGSFYSSKKFREIEEESRRKAQEEFLDIEQGESDNERDEEFAQWEKEQIRKGVSAQQMAFFHSEVNGSGSYSQHYISQGTLGLPYSFLKSNDYISSDTLETRDPEPMELDVDHVQTEEELPKEKPAITPKLGGGETTEKNLTIDDLILRIKARLIAAEQMISVRSLGLEKLNQHLAENNATVERLETLEPKQNDQYRLYQEMRAYSRDLLECLNEKIGQIESLDKQMVSLLKVRREFFVRRRRQDVKDQFEECSVAESGKVQALQEDAEKMMRIAEREARRSRRRQAREQGLAGISHRDGLSSDDEEAPSRIASFAADKEKIFTEASTVFKDTLEEFCSVKAICEHFTNWIEKDESSFNEAFIGLCVPKLLCPIILLDMLSWNPVESDCLDLSRYSWYRGCLLLGCGEENDWVANLIPELVEKVICTKLAVLVENAWDPVSTSQSQRLASLLLSLVERFPSIQAESTNVHTLLMAVQRKAKEALDDDLFMPIYGQDSIENNATGAKVFLDRQFWLALKVFKNIVLFDGFLSSKTVQELALDGILNRHLVLGLQCSVFTEPFTLIKCKKVAAAIPPNWIEATSRSASFVRQLSPFSKIICRIGEEIYRKNAEPEALKDIGNLLTRLGLAEQAKRTMFY